jgi:hypothetical protein
MSQQTAKRRRAQAKNGFRHMAPQKRPHYAKRYMSIADSIARARQTAAREAASKQKKRKE